MKIINKLTAASFLIFVSMLFTACGYTQNNVIQCDSYDSLYNTIKAGNSASINKTCFINEFSLVEKSLITVVPSTVVDGVYKIIFEVKELEKGENKESYETGSVLGFMVTGCKTFGGKYKNFVNTSCWINVTSPDEAKDIVKRGIDFSVDAGYNIEGDLVIVFQKTCAKDPGHTVVKKPAVYLYPESEMNVSVSVEVNGKLTYTEPEYKNGWNVNVKPDGLIDGKYDYLFYEADLKKIELPEEGWIVEFGKLENWFDKYLPQFGLNKKETEQFKEYWMKDLKKANYYEIKLLGNKFLEENMKLKIYPEPQTILRLNFYFKPAFEKREIKPPVVNTIKRNGFTVIEWGGINASDFTAIP
jgi:hypothetical protein